MFEIIDDNGVIHSGGEDEMRKAFMVMNGEVEHIETEFPEDLKAQYDAEWSGDLKLIEVHEVTR